MNRSKKMRLRDGARPCGGFPARALGLLAVVWLVACTSSTSGKRLVVFAAASLSESFAEIGKQFEASHPDTRVILNLAGSQQLVTQLEHGARADVLASANTREMDGAIRAGLVVSGTQHIFVRNRLVIIVPRNNPGQVASPADLARPGLKIDVADASVPVGQYTLDMLARMSQDPALGPAFPARVQANVVSREDNVRSVVSKVRLGEADAGVVYASDTSGEASQELRTLPVPDPFNVIATFPIAPIKDTTQPERAREFIDFVLSSQGQRVLANYGFIPVETQP